MIRCLCGRIVEVRKCECDCGEVFIPRIRTQRYVNRTHKNRAAQARLRKRERSRPEAVIPVIAEFIGNVEGRRWV
jgi:hypothetical protein